jgi:heavy metal sensor kinase
MINSVRVRLTFWYVFIFGSLLVAFSLLVYALLTRSIYDQVDQSLSNTARATATEFQSEIAEFEGDAAAGAGETLNELQLPGIHMAIFEGDHLLASNTAEVAMAISARELAAARNEGRASFRAVGGFGEQGARLAVLPVSIGGKEYCVALVTPLDDVMEQIEAIRRIFYIGLPATLLIAGASGFLLARKSLSPVVEMSEQAKRMGAANLGERLKVASAKDELGRLAGAFNELLSRLSRSFENMRGFMADASHELRTPLSIIRGEADVALSQDREKSEYRESLAIIQDEARRLSRIVDDMLALARADAGQHPLEVREFYLNDLVEEAARSMKVLAASRGVSVAVYIAEDVAFRGDEDLIRRLVMNLLDNAIKYTPEGGSVSVRLVMAPPGVKLIVSDTGIGIPAEAAAHVFERFYRVDRARSRAEGGSGLGLSIAKWVAEAHKGSIELISRPGQGSEFVVSLCNLPMGES